jgi:acyl-CoA thioesterase II
VRTLVVVATIQSAWPTHPGYSIDLVPLRGTARVTHGDLVLAESTSALRLIETDHVERLYFPISDVRLDLLETNDHHTICPFKGQADYWSLVAGPSPVEDVFWTYPDPFDEVGGIKGFLGVYHEKVHVECETRWPNDSGPAAVALSRFPIWGDQADLVGLLDAEEAEPHRFVAPGYHERSRNVVEGGQLLGEAIVAASKAIPGQRVTWASMTFPKSASFDTALELAVEPLRQGRTFSTVEVRATQEGRLVAPGLVMMDSGADDTIRDRAEMPDVPGPGGSVPHDMRVHGRALRVVDGAYDPDPDRIGPPVLYAWVRFRDNPAEAYLRQALVAQASTHWTIAAAMRPHRGFGEAQAHVTLSTGIMSVTIAFHDDAPVDEWFLYSNTAIWSGRGLAQGEGRVFTAGGTLVASYTVQAMIREFARTPDTLGMNSTNVM